MIFSSSRKDESTLWALIDIQSGMVRGSVVLFRKKDGKGPAKKEILFTTIHPVHKKANPAVGQISKVMLHNVSEVTQLMAREGMQRARAAGYTGDFTGVHYILSSPWVISQTRTISVSYTRPTAITQATIQELVN